jgi:Peptidase A4 family
MAMSGADDGRATATTVPVGVIDDLKKRFVAFPTPPDRFDPVSASAMELNKYGLPPRPDPNTQPLLRQVWDRGFGAPLTLLEFRLEVEKIEETRYRPQLRQAKERPVSETRFETSSDWSGAYITANEGKQFVQIWGMWKIPGNLKVPPLRFQGPPGVDYICSNWIGLDGQRFYLDSSLPQIGTLSQLQPDGSTTVQAWTQWWARYNSATTPVPLPLPVAPGNLVLSVLTALDPRTVVLAMVNLSTLNAMAVTATAPTVQLPPYNTTATPEIAGATAEWIVERPAIPGQTTRYNFPDYGETEFDFCIAVEGASVGIASLLTWTPQVLRGARLIRMFDVLPDPTRTAFISMPRKLNDTAVGVAYGGF